MPDTDVTVLPLSGAEALKRGSHGLRGSVAAEIARQPRGGVSEATYGLLKFHGTYEQFNRDSATALKQAGLDKDWMFMVRVRTPGGILTGAQYLALDAIAGRFADGTLKITTRQGIQFHGVRIADLKPAIAAINAALMTTYAACGDVVRNVMTTPAPRRDAIHARLREDAIMLSDRLLPQSRGYYEIFLDAPPSGDPVAEEEPIYGPTYLPRKFKIALAHPDDNTVDVLANDLGFIALFEAGQLLGYQVCVGGGHGMTHNNPRTYPRVASQIGFVAPDQLWPATLAVLGLQRDNGDRTNRRRARLKYVVDDRGLEWVRDQLVDTYGLVMSPPRPLPPLRVPELLGWHVQGDGCWWLGIPVDSGRIAGELRAVLQAAVTRFDIGVVLTPQQDVLLTDVRPEDRDALDRLLADSRAGAVASPLAQWTLACTALPYCGLALTEAERARGPIVAQVEAALSRHGMADERISLRIAGCPNGCSRPYGGDIGLVGRVPGQYALFVGGDFEGTRLSFKLVEKVPVARIGEVLEPLFAAWAAGRAPGEGFGDYCNRQGPAKLQSLLPMPASQEI